MNLDPRPVFVAALTGGFVLGVTFANVSAMFGLAVGLVGLVVIVIIFWWVLYGRPS